LALETLKLLIEKQFNGKRSLKFDSIMMDFEKGARKACLEEMNIAFFIWFNAGLERQEKKDLTKKKEII